MRSICFLYVLLVSFVVNAQDIYLLTNNRTKIQRFDTAACALQDIQAVYSDSALAAQKEITTIALNEQNEIVVLRRNYTSSFQLSEGLRFGKIYPGSPAIQIVCQYNNSTLDINRIASIYSLCALGGDTVCFISNNYAGTYATLHYFDVGRCEMLNEIVFPSNYSTYIDILRVGNKFYCNTDAKKIVELTVNGNTVTTRVLHNNRDIGGMFQYCEGNEMKLMMFPNEITDTSVLLSMNIASNRIETVSCVIPKIPYLNIPDVASFYRADKATIINQPKVIYHCNAASISDTLRSAYENNSWSTGETTKQIIVTQPGTYWLRSVTVCGTYSDTILVKNITELRGFLGKDENKCTVDSVY